MRSSQASPNLVFIGDLRCADLPGGVDRIAQAAVETAIACPAKFARFVASLLAQKGLPS